MRTTVTLEEDVAAGLRKLAQRRGASFKEVLNETVRRGLRAQDRSRRPGSRFVIETFTSALQPGIDPDKLGQLVDQLEAEDFAHEAASGR